MDIIQLRARLDALEPLTLGHLPTPIAALPRLSAALGGPKLWVKRDDLTGLGLGGNKVRKLTFLLADALRQRADVIMTTGAQQSNHARQTAAAAAKVGLPCILVLGGDAPALAQGNYLLDELLGAEVRWAGAGSPLRALEREAEIERRAGRHPYVATYGGSSAVGACGFVAALLELAQQAPSFDAIVIASSSGGTQTGLAVAARALNYPGRIIGVSISEAAAPFQQRMAKLAAETSELLGLDFVLAPEDFIVADAYLGEGYGVLGARERQAIHLAARTEGLFVDPVYTGRALGGLMDLVQRGALRAGERVLFWHTGGAPALFAYAEKLRA